MEPNRVLQVENVSRSYTSGAEELCVLRDVHFAMEVGATCAIVGPSGSGKTTLLGLCAGLDRPSEGRIVLCGQDLGPLNEDELAHLRNQQVGFVFQSFRLIATLTARENVMVPLELRGGDHPRAEADTLLERVGLQDRGDHYPAQLSGGEQQRVALARAFIHRPRILFADEPTGNLDAETSHRVVELLFGLNQDFGTALLLVTHDHELAGRTDRILTMRSGQVVQDAAATRTDPATTPLTRPQGA